jgi:hypothetical protein
MNGENSVSGRNSIDARHLISSRSPWLTSEHLKWMDRAVSYVDNGGELHLASLHKKSEV